jgi:ABC transport system ATP-binding/permease protein
MPRDFCGDIAARVVGGSGAGKSTLLGALIGIRPGRGQVELNGRDFYKEYEHFRAQLGYVPQATSCTPR